MWRDTPLVEVKCDFCGCDRTREICYRPDSLRVVECVRCGLAFVNPRPHPDAIAALYQSNYFDNHHHIGYTDYYRQVNGRRTFPELELLERHVSLCDKSLIEIGCATGAMLATARTKGATVTGVELSAGAAHDAVTAFGLDVHTGALEDLRTDLGIYDIAVACEVIEHVNSPMAFLRKLAALLVPGGYLLLSTPNYRCARRFGAQWFGFQRSFEHLYFFTDEILARMAASVHLREICWFTRGDGNGTMPSYRSAAKRICIDLGLYGPIARLKAMIPHRIPAYERYGQGHGLLSLFQKQPAALIP